MLAPADDAKMLCLVRLEDYSCSARLGKDVILLEFMS
jgi:hypothetical protein